MYCFTCAFNCQFLKNCSQSVSWHVWDACNICIYITCFMRTKLPSIFDHSLGLIMLQVTVWDASDSIEGIEHHSPFKSPLLLCIVLFTFTVPLFSKPEWDYLVESPFLRVVICKRLNNCVNKEITNSTFNTKCENIIVFLFPLAIVYVLVRCYYEPSFKYI